MAGFFQEFDVPHQRVVLYTRVTAPGPNVVYFEDESVLGETTDKMTDVSGKTGIAAPSVGINYSVPYLPDAGGVYFAEHPKDTELKDGNAKLTVTVKAGKPGYALQWYKDGKEVVNIPDTFGELTVSQPGKYFVLVRDADGVEAVSKEVEVK